MAIHEDAWDTLGHAGQDGRAYRLHENGIASETRGGRTHGDIRHEMTISAGCQRSDALSKMGGDHPSMTSAGFSVNNAS